MATTKNGKLQFTDAQYNIARYDASALKYALQNGYPLIKKGQHYYHKDHDSMVFTEDGRWFWNSRGLQGRAIELLMYYEEKTLPEAVLVLAGDMQSWPPYSLHKPVEVEKAEKRAFSPPVESKSFKQLFGYLVTGRGLDVELIKPLVQQGDIYPTTHIYNDKILYNAVFVGRDESGIVRSAFQHGCSTYSNFKMEAVGSDKACPFVVRGREDAKKLCIFEGAIDALSHASIAKLAGQDWQNAHRLAQGGNAPIEGVLRFLVAHPQVTQVEFCMDADVAGALIAQRAQEQLAEVGFTGAMWISCSPVHKDWNDYLKVWRETVRNHANIQAQEQIGHETHTYGRIHHIDSHGKLRKTVAYHSKQEFTKDTANLLHDNASVIVETEGQLAELERQAQKKTAQQANECDVGMEM